MSLSLLSQFMSVTKRKVPLALFSLLCSVVLGNTPSPAGANNAPPLPPTAPVKFPAAAKALTMAKRKEIIRAQTAQYRAEVPSDPPMSTGKHFQTNGCVATHIGDRSYQEDTSLIGEVQTKNGKTYKVYAVFDGHGGSRASEFCKENFLTFLADVANEKSMLPFSKILYDAVKKVDNIWNTFNRLRLNKYDEHGTTINVLVVEEETGRAWVANVGDSRCIMLKNNWPGPAKAILQNTYAFTIDHNVETNPFEKARILKCGGKIDSGYVMWDKNPLGGWAISRHVGSRALCLATIPHPDIYVQELKDIEYFVLATDGFWDAVPNAVAEAKTRDFIKEGKSEQDMAQSLLEYCQVRTKDVKVCPQFKGKLWDNVTIVVVSVNAKSEPNSVPTPQPATPEPTQPAMVNQPTQQPAQQTPTQQQPIAPVAQQTKPVQKKPDAKQPKRVAKSKSPDSIQIEFGPIKLEVPRPDNRSLSQLLEAIQKLNDGKPKLKQ